MIVRQYSDKDIEEEEYEDPIKSGGIGNGAILLE
jgi:hypothetical protein